jgi:large repetitive protein
VQEQVTIMAARFSTTLLAAMAVLAAVGCTVKKTEAPPPSGPSELATSLTLQASPDVLPLDGSSQAQLVIFARDAESRPRASLPLHVDITISGVTQDFGRLSAKDVVTGSDGRATITYTAPAAADSVDRGTTVTLLVTPVDGDARAQVARSVDIRLLPTGVITPPETAVPDFAVAPERPLILESVLFDASDASLDGTLTAYAWTFGDGGSAAGRTTHHQFREAGTFVVTLTVTDDTGRRGSRAKSVAVEQGDAPTAAFVFSPAAPQPNDKVFFNGIQSIAAPGRVIVKYAWNFGDGDTATGSVPSHTYEAVGTYNVTLKVTDDAGIVGTVTQAVTVAVPEEETAAAAGSR